MPSSSSYSDDDPCPFDAIIVTSPDRQASEAASAGPLKELGSTFPNHKNVQIVSTYDPFGARCGSGGGTLAALDKYYQTVKSASLDDDVVLIVHAGGDSSRCPTQMVLGKAWTTLPLIQGDGDDQRVITSNPTVLLIQTLSRMCRSIPKGSVVVVASDCILHLPTMEGSSDSAIDWDSKDYQQSVMGVAVPAPLSTAKNHGVFVLNPQGGVQQVLQKPSISEMYETENCVLSSDNDDVDQAWIDTGVIVFSPTSAKALRHLTSSTSLRACTERGLQGMWEDETRTMSCGDFGRAHAIKVELYTHFLLALSSNSSMSQDEYVKMFSNDALSLEILTDVYTALSPFSLGVMALHAGRFLHLGTSRELVDFAIYGSCPNRSRQQGNESVNQQLCRDIGAKLRLSKYVGSVLGDPAKVSDDCVVVNSVLLGDGESISIGSGTVVEHTLLECTPHIEIGKDCLVSGVRGECDSFHLPDAMCLQILSLTWNRTNAYVYMCFGMNDGIKSGDTIYGMKVNDVLRWTGMEEADLWGKDGSAGLLWNARIHPIVAPSTDDGPSTKMMYNDLFGWVPALRRLSQGSDATLPCGFAKSFASWKDLPRVSLSEIRRQSNPDDELRYRIGITNKNVPLHQEKSLLRIKETLLQRRHDPTKLTLGLLDFAATGSFRECRSTCAMIDHVVMEAMLRGHYDICGRALTIESSYLNYLAGLNRDDSRPRLMSAGDEQRGRDLFDREVQSLQMRMSSKEQRSKSMERLAHARDLTLKESESPFGLQLCSQAMEQAAAAMTEICVSGSTTQESTLFPRTSPAPADSWVVATAPARIDFAGAWSDTPPICFEYGGAVLNFAVTIDGKKPLSCRCRVVPGGHGIKLRAEARESLTGSLRSDTYMSLSTIGDFGDCRNPAAGCALFKCALVHMGLVSLNQIDKSPDGNLQPYINRFCQSDTNVGMEIVSTSLLPQGSGMGTSSILAGCILASIGKCCGVDISYNDKNLIHAVLMIEQLLTTGGGWQDQVGGLIGGFKLATSATNVLPLSVSVEQLQLDPRTRDELNSRLVLAFTGKTRLAKNILQTVLQRWAQRSPEIVQTVSELVQAASVARDAILNGNVEQLASSLNEFWAHKRLMAGPASGVEPHLVRDLIHYLSTTNEIAAASLCGAGGGGFMVLLTSKGRSVSDVISSSNDFLSNCDDADDFAWHDCAICEEGLTTETLPRESNGLTLDSFSMAWHEVN